MAIVRIDPRSCPLWRDARTLQFGLDGPVLLRDPAPWQERALSELERGFPASDDAQSVDPARLATSCGGPADRVAELLTLLEPVLRRDDRGSVGVAVRAADPLPEAIVSIVVDALSERGWPAVWVAPGEDTVDPRTPTILLASHVVPPHLGVRCARADAPHLPIVFTDAGAEVGPVVVPGSTACLACLDIHRAERDPAWPVIASQLLLRRPAPVTMSLAVEAVALATRLLRDELQGAGETNRTEPTRSVVVDADDPADPADERPRRWRAHRPHAECLCGGRHPARGEQPTDPLSPAARHAGTLPPGAGRPSAA